jgi:hypothetical protein
MRPTPLATFAVAAALLAAGAPARAIDDLTGTYTGKLACRTHTGAERPVKSKRELTIHVVDHEKDPVLYVQILADETPVGATIHATRFPDARPDRAKLAGADCGLNVYTQQGLAFQADAVVTPGSTKGALKGSLTVQRVEPLTADFCTFVAKRVSVEPTGINVCSIPIP